jgi:glycosyltransferase involved in cell wall biosynthesis
MSIVNRRLGAHSGQRQLRILHTVRSLRVDGVVRVILRNVANRDGVKFAHEVCSLRDECDLANECRKHGIEPVFMGYTGPSSVPTSIRRMVRLINERHIDLVHANRTIDLAIAGTAAKLCGIPVVSSLHWLGRLDEHPHDAARTPWVRRWLEMKATVALNRALATSIVAVSKAVQSSYSSLPGFPSDRMQVIYPGLDFQRPQVDTATMDHLRRSLGLERSTPVVLNVGRLEAVKGQHHLIPVMVMVRDRLPHARLLIAGEGTLRSALANAIAATGLDNQITLLGVREDVDALLNIADVVIVTSESESFGLPLVEAMRAGKPVVATDVGGIPELVAHGVNGLIVPRADTTAMVTAILTLLEHPERAREMGAAGREIALQRFDVRDSMRSLESLYAEIIDGRVLPRADRRE